MALLGPHPPGTATSTSGGVTESRVNVLIAAAQRVIYPNADMSWPDPESNDDKILLVEDDTAYHVHEAYTTDDPNTVTWSTTLPDSLNIRGAYTLANRPPANAANYTYFVYLTDRNRWQFCGRHVPSGGEDTYYVWLNWNAPAGWIGAFDTEADADEAASAVNDLAYFDDEFQIVTDFVDGTVHTNAFWEPLSEADRRARVEQRVVHPDEDGNWPDAESNTGKLLVVPDGRVYHVHHEVHGETDPTATWDTTLPSALNVIGSYTTGNRPTPNAARVGQRLWNRSLNTWQICSEFNNEFTEPIYAWENSRAPAGWIGHFDTEAEATRHATQIGSLAYWPSALRITTAYAAGTQAANRYYWIALGEGDSEDDDGGDGTADLTRAEELALDDLAGAQSGELTPGAAAVQVVFGSGDAELISKDAGNDFTLSAGLYMLELEADFTTSAQNRPFNFEIRQASDDDVLAVSNTPVTGTNQSEHHDLRGLLALSSDASVNINLVSTRTGVNIAMANGVFRAYRWGGGVSDAADPSDYIEELENVDATSARSARIHVSTTQLTAQQALDAIEAAEGTGSGITATSYVYFALNAAIHPPEDIISIAWSNDQDGLGTQRSDGTAVDTSSLTDGDAWRIFEHQVTVASGVTAVGVEVDTERWDGEVRVRRVVEQMASLPDAERLSLDAVNIPTIEIVAWQNTEDAGNQPSNGLITVQAEKVRVTPIAFPMFTGARDTRRFHISMPLTYEMNFWAVQGENVLSNAVARTTTTARIYRLGPIRPNGPRNVAVQIVEAA